MSALGNGRHVHCTSPCPLSAKSRHRIYNESLVSGAAKACANLPRNHYLEFTNKSGLRAVIFKTASTLGHSVFVRS